jgi:hypothetical protein
VRVRLVVYCWDFAHSEWGAGYPVAVWDNVYGFDYSVIKDIALREPLVDTVELRATVTNPCKFKVEGRMKANLFLTDRPLS